MIGDASALFTLKDRVILVTGAARGNGLVLAGRLAAMGAIVYGLDRSFEGDYPFATLQADVRDDVRLRQVVDEIIGRHGVIHGLVNNAGITLPPEQCYSRATVEATLAVNTLAPLLLGHMVAETMKESGGGSIVNITSLAAHRGFNNNPGYQASKAALAQISRAMAADYGPFNIRVNSLCPGYILTDMTRASYEDPVRRQQRQDRMLLPRWGLPEDLVGPCIFLLSDASAYVTGMDLPVDGGWLAKGM